MIRHLTTIFLLGILSAMSTSSHGQPKPTEASSLVQSDSFGNCEHDPNVFQAGKKSQPQLGIDNNRLYCFNAAWDVGIETRLNDELSLNVSAGYHLCTCSGNKKF